MTEVTNIIKELAEMQEKFNQMKKEAVEKLEPQFVEVFKPLFEAAPEIEAVTWTQYIPSFNDGEPCEFSVRDLWVVDEATIKAHIEENYEEDEEYDRDEIIHDLLSDEGFPSIDSYAREPDKYWYESDGVTVRDWYKSDMKRYQETPPEKREKIKAFKKIWNNIPEGILQDMFGFNARVTVTRNGVVSEKYDCGY
jgi:hypothetical protein